MYEVKSLKTLNQPGRTVYRSQSYARALLFLEQNIEARPNLDLFRDGSAVAWELEPTTIS